MSSSSVTEFAFLHRFEDVVVLQLFDVMSGELNLRFFEATADADEEVPPPSIELAAKDFAVTKASTGAVAFGESNALSMVG